MASDVCQDLGGATVSFRCAGKQLCIKQTFAFNPSLQIASQSSLDCSDAAGLVNSIWNQKKKYCQRKHSLLPWVELWGGERFSESYIVNAEIIQRLRNFNLLGRVEKGISKLLALSQRALNDFKRADVAEEVRYRLVRIPAVDGRARLPRLGVNGCEFTCGVQLILFIALGRSIASLFIGMHKRPDARGGRERAGTISVRSDRGRHDFFRFC